MSFPHRSFRFLALASVMAASGSFGNAHAQVIYRHTSMPPLYTPSTSPAGTSGASSIHIVHRDAALSPAQPEMPSASAPGASGSADGIISADHFGHDVPFSLAVMSILPKGYTAQYEAGVDQNKLVNWAGGRSWHDILDSLSSAHGYDVRYAGKTVVVSQATAATAGVVTAPIVSQPTVDNGSTALHVHEATPASAPVPVAAQPVVASIPANPPPTEMGVEAVQQSVTARELGLKAAGGSVQGVVANNRQYNDGGLVPSDALAGDHPRLSYAPKGGGYGIYYGAAGQSVDQVIRVWAAANGWNVVDDTNMSYKLDVPVSLRGDFKSSVRAILGSLAVNPKPQHMFLNGGSTIHLYLQEDQMEEAPTGNALKMHMGKHQF